MRRPAAAALLALALAGCATSQTPPATGPQADRHPRPPGQIASLQHDLDAVLSSPRLARSSWGVLVKSLDRGDVLFARDAGKLVMPASNMKLVTMAGAAERLGWNYRYDTTIETSATVDADGVLGGDLIVKGAGDPSIGTLDNVAARTFDEWAGQLRALGIRSIAGRIVGDDDAFDDDEIGAGWAFGDLAYGYAAPITALYYNEGVFELSAQPGASVGGPAILRAAPLEHGLTIVNLVTTVAAGGEADIEAHRQRGSLLLEVTGTVPLGRTEPVTTSPAVENPTLYFARVVRSALIARGIDVKGAAVDRDDLAPEDPLRLDAPAPRVVARHTSEPLSVIARRFLKVSQNQYAELLVKTVGRQAGEGSTARGQQVIRSVLDQWGVPPNSYILFDGSGLSRYNYLSAEALVDVLEHMYRDPRHREPLVAALPLSGEEGSLRRRLTASWTKGSVHAKTGSLAGVGSLTGDVRTRGGEMLVFSIVANNFSQPAAEVVRDIDLLVEILARQQDRR
jgi:D-alanyl-D-alanine carboxypeptidase/D-alanyl-D-alanine-endopeptidase (penicillin-binding protein 4)